MPKQSTLDGLIGYLLDSSDWEVATFIREFLADYLQQPVITETHPLTYFLKIAILRLERASKGPLVFDKSKKFEDVVESLLLENPEQVYFHKEIQGPVTFFRDQILKDLEHHAFGPKTKDHSTYGRLCHICGDPFQEGDYTTMVILGPGKNPENQAKARNKKPYDAIGLEVHYTCATGHVHDEKP